MTHLEQLEMSLSRSLIPIRRDIDTGGMLLVATAAGVKELKIPCMDSRFATIIREWADQGNPLPSVINILATGEDSEVIASQLFLFGQNQVLNYHHLRLVYMTTKEYQ